MSYRSRRTKQIAIALGAVAVAAVVAVGVAVGHGSRSAPVSSAPASGAPSLAGTDAVTGKRVSLADFRGRPVVVNIWASWCPGCNQEAADLARFARAHPAVGVLGIDFRDTRSGAKSFYRRWGWRHPSIFDPNGDLAATLGLQGLPTTVFLNARHRIVGRIVGAGTLRTFDEGLRKAA